MASGLRKKAMWAKKRAENAAKREEERKAALPTRKVRKVFTELKPRESKFVITEAMKRTASAPSATAPVRSPILKPVDRSEEWLRREAAAHAETERKKKMVAPLYNKGGYQYVGDAPPEIIKTLGRKV